ncbi:S8 family serine peptidase [Micromonospora sp. WMMD1082]|uniref:S8 family peptidase n=1 Tax=Micromonospora sp. WMMD1082 TaxID=3016104 RepID=UPI002416B455|nr:S8 family serine peptidase [Micromonospora sp. WMMD1082]MDG4798151.1 S8 family serine peptidase [Micromonospora sp. WMMD1082]
MSAAERAAERASLRQLRERELAARGGLSPIAATAHAYYRPRDLVLTVAARDRLADRLSGYYNACPVEKDPGDWRRSIGLDAEQDLGERLPEVGRSLWRLPEQVSPAEHLALVHELRDRLSTGVSCAGGGGGVAVALNHVFFGEPLYQGGPGGEPRPVAEPPAAFRAAPGNGTGVDLAVLDTGLPDGWESLHPGLDGRLFPNRDDRRATYVDGRPPSRTSANDTRILASQSGHGLFACGLAQRAAPGLRVDPGLVLDASGVGDDASIAAELHETTAPVVNLSLGGYTEDDLPPPTLTDAIAAKGENVVVVAAAGNNDGATRLFWPAALPGVIAVAGYDSTGGGPAETDFSNRGPWVDVCAPARDLVSSYVRGTYPAHDGDRVLRGWAAWSGTSFATVLVAAEIARRVRDARGERTPRQVALAFVEELDASRWDGLGRIYVPPADYTDTDRPPTA